jgi:hypothetical protein
MALLRLEDSRLYFLVVILTVLKSNLQEVVTCTSNGQCSFSVGVKFFRNINGFSTEEIRNNLQAFED